MMRAFPGGEGGRGSARGRMRRDCTAITRVRAAAARFALISPLRGQLPPMGKPNEKAPLAERFPVLTYSLSYNTAGTAGAKDPWHL